MIAKTAETIVQSEKQTTSQRDYWLLIVRTVEASARWYERREARFRPVDDTVEARDAGRLILEEWARHVVNGDQELFATRLQFDGVSREEAELLAAGVRLQDGQELPKWAACLERVLMLGSAISGCTLEELENQSPWIRESESIPFVPA